MPINESDDAPVSLANGLTRFPAALVAAGLAYLLLGAAGLDRPLPAPSSGSTGEGGDVVVVRAKRVERPFVPHEAVALAPRERTGARDRSTSRRTTPPRSGAADQGGRAPHGGAAAPAQPGAPQSRPAGADPSPGNVSPPIHSAPAGLPPSSPAPSAQPPAPAPESAPPSPPPPRTLGIAVALPLPELPPPPTVQVPSSLQLPAIPQVPTLPELPKLPQLP